MELGLTEALVKANDIKGVKRVQYFDSRYYRVEYSQKGKIMHKHFPSVTEILSAAPKDFIAKWRGDVGNDRADQIMFEAFKLGSFIHYGAEIIAKGGAVIYNPAVNPTYTDKEIDQLVRKHGNVVICRWQKEFIQLYRIWQLFTMLNPQRIETEQTVYSLKHKFAGTLDLIFYLPKDDEYMIAGSSPLYLEKGYYMGDYKTGKGISSTNKMQMSAYAEAVLEALPKMREQMKGLLLIHPNNELIKNGIPGLKCHLINMDEQKMYFQQFLKIYDVYLIDKPVPTPKEFEMPSVLFLEQPKEKKKKKK